MSTDITWADYTGQGPRSTGKPSRTHRIDGSRRVTDPPSPRYTSCGITIPSMGADRFASIFEVTTDEGTGYCRRCFPRMCERCRRRRFVANGPGGWGCCDAHGKALCHLCYRLTHHVEVCTPSCAYCIDEGLPLILTASNHRRIVTTPDISTVGS